MRFDSVAEGIGSPGGVRDGADAMSRIEETLRYVPTGISEGARNDVKIGFVHRSLA
jgi:hypothetical protein